MITYVDKPKNLLLELKSEFSKVASYKVNIKHQFYFYILAALKNKIFKIPLTNNVCVCVSIHMSVCVYARGGGIIKQM